MVIREYPKEIKELMKIYEPYMVGCHLENAPPEAIEAFKKVKKWSWEQGQEHSVPVPGKNGPK